MSWSRVRLAIGLGRKARRRKALRLTTAIAGS